MKKILDGIRTIFLFTIYSTFVDNEILIHDRTSTLGEFCYFLFSLLSEVRDLYIQLFFIPTVLNPSGSEVLWTIRMRVTCDRNKSGSLAYPYEFYFKLQGFLSRINLVKATYFSIILAHIKFFYDIIFSLLCFNISCINLNAFPKMWSSN